MPLLDEQYFRSNFNTGLSLPDEAAFQQWIRQQSQLQGRNIGMDLGNYDLRGFFKSSPIVVDARGHMTDKFKKPNHPTFSDESIYHDTPSPFGANWQGGKWGDNTYTPSQFMLDHTHNLVDLLGYMKQVEPGVTVNMPKDN